MSDAESREAERLAALHSLGLLDITAGDDFDQITQLAAHCFGVPIALISLVDTDRQRFLSRVGFALPETPRHDSICAHAIYGVDILEVPDLRHDPRFSGKSMVVGDPHIRFYAGIPLITASGHAIGALCIIDVKPNQLTAAQRQQLQTLGQIVMDRVALRQSIGRRDAVTHLPNRHQMVADLESLNEADQGGPHALALLDVLDGSLALEVTQAVGLAVTDSLLRYAAEQTATVLPSHVKLYHIGATRFAFWFDPTAEPDLLIRVQARLHAQARGAGVPMQLRPIIGVVPFSPGLIVAVDLLRQAMIAVNSGHAAGQPVSWYCREVDELQRRRYRLALDLRHALERGQFHLVFQPRVSAHDGRVSSLEALIRWQHPDYGAISPAQFIPLLERTAWMQSLTLWVIDEAMRHLQIWRDAHPSLRMSVNLSPRDFDAEGLVQGVLTACMRHGGRADWLELEVTEGEWLRTNPTVIQQMTQLVEAGVTLAIDDFGTGYSNFAYMHQIPAKVLKIDQSLVAGVLEQEHQAVLVRGVVGLAKRLGYSVVAEGVETADILDFVLDCGCDEIQGYYFSRPLAPENIPRLLTNFRPPAARA